MPGVSLKELRWHCNAAFRQTLIRDGVALAALGTAAFLAPLGTALVLTIIVAAVILAGRVRLSSPLVLGAATGVALALTYGRDPGLIRLLPPLIAIGACFLVYTADNLWARQRVRHLLRERTGPAEDNPGHKEQERTAAPEPFRSRFNSQSRNVMPMLTAEPVRVFYEKERIVGTGTPWPRSALTVAVDKPAQGKTSIVPFHAVDLISYIAAHLRAQGAVSQGTNGFAYGKVFLDGEWHPLGMPPPLPNGRAPYGGPELGGLESFTHGLPDLDVREVIAVPVPRAKLVPVWWFFIRYVTPQLLGRHPADQTKLADQDYKKMAERPPTASPERHYVRASTTTWDGQLIASIYVSAVLQAHYLRVLIRPYVLAPIGPELRHAGHLAQLNIAVQLVGAIHGTIRQGMLMIGWLHRLGSSPDNRRISNTPRPKLDSTREHYALAYTDNLHHTEDADRMIQVMELKAFQVTREYLRNHDVDLEDYDKQVEVYVNSTVFRGNIENSGNLAVGNMNQQQQGSGGSNEGRNGNK